MLIDVTLKPSQWQRYAEWLMCSIMVLLLWIAGLPVWLKLALIFLLIFLQYVLRVIIKTPKPQQIWQIDSVDWALRDHHNGKIRQGTLLNIEYRVLVLSLSFLIAGRKQHVVIWRDQVDQRQWRYFKIIANLKQMDKGILS
jgi:hypothetical protein